MVVVSSGAVDAGTLRRDHIGYKAAKRGPQTKDVIGDEVCQNICAYPGDHDAKHLSALIVAPQVTLIDAWLGRCCCT